MPDALEELGSSFSGLSSEEAAKRLAVYGPNALPAIPPTPLWRLFLRQFESSLIYVLIAAAGLIYFLHGLSDALVIVTVLLFNAVVGVAQEGRAQNTLSALKRYLEAKATVFRDGEKVVLADAELVPGDVIWLQEGEKVPADARIVHGSGLLVSEAALTGESTPVHKIGEELLTHAQLPIADQKNMLFKGSLVLGGNGRAVLTATGSSTHIGSLSSALAADGGEVPLKKEIESLSKFVIIAVFFLCVSLAGIGVLKGYEPADMLSVAVSLAVSMIPEGLPVVLTLILSTGVWRMSRRNALVKKLQAVEGLGQVDVIAVDKTGTITKNEMTVTHLYLKGSSYVVEGAGYAPVGAIVGHGRPADARSNRSLAMAARIAAYCASATLTQEASGDWRVGGDPTEAAMLVFAQKAGAVREELLARHPILEELPFDYRTKVRSVLGLAENGRHLLAVCGAPEAVMQLCEMHADDRAVAEEAVRELSLQGLRVVGFASKEGAFSSIEPHLTKLKFGGFFGMQDPLHEEVPAAVRAVRKAGVKVVLITGDHALTARSIAQSASIAKESDLVVSGTELELMTEDELLEKLPNISVFCRVSPEQKLRIVSAFRSAGYKIAMTGDGVNDAPSLVAADLGVAMGKAGTEVAKEAADIVLLDDNFASIVAAIEEGRGIYAIIRTVVAYLFTTSVAEVAAIAGGILFGLPLVLEASQIIWLNFVTDGFLTAALAMEPQDGSLAARSRGRRIVDREAIGSMAMVGVGMAAGSLATFALFLHTAGIARASTVAMTSLAAVQWAYAWVVRRRRYSKNLRTSPYLRYATFLVIALQVAVVQVPALQPWLHTVSLAPVEWAASFLPALIILFIGEATRKLSGRRTAGAGVLARS